MKWSFAWKWLREEGLTKNNLFYMSENIKTCLGKNTFSRIDGRLFETHPATNPNHSGSFWMALSQSGIEA